MSKVCDDKPMDFDYVLAFYPNEDPDCLLLTMIDIRNAGYPPKTNCINLFEFTLFGYILFGIPQRKKRLIRKYYKKYKGSISRSTLTEVKRRREWSKEKQKAIPRNFCSTISNESNLRENNSQ